MKTIKTLAVVSILTLGMTTSVFAVWWNPFTWAIFKKKEQVKQSMVTPVSSTTDSQIASTSIPTQTVTDTVITNTSFSFKVIKCNPKTYDEKYFSEQKPCVSDLDQTDKEREAKALKIIKEAKLKGLPSVDLITLHVSDKQYQLFDVNFGAKIGYLVVDTINEKVTDYFGFAGSGIVQIDEKRIVASTGPRNSIVSLVQYEYGTEKLAAIKDSEIVEPKTYLDGKSLETDNGIRVLATSTDSLTLGIYDKNDAVKKPEIYWISYKQIGTKVIDLSKPSIQVVDDPVKNGQSEEITVQAYSVDDVVKNGAYLMVTDISGKVWKVDYKNVKFFESWSDANLKEQLRQGDFAKWIKIVEAIHAPTFEGSGMPGNVKIKGKIGEDGMLYADFISQHTQ